MCGPLFKMATVSLNLSHNHMFWNGKSTEISVAELFSRHSEPTYEIVMEQINLEDDIVSYVMQIHTKSRMYESKSLITCPTIAGAHHFKVFRAEMRCEDLRVLCSECERQEPVKIAIAEALKHRIKQIKHLNSCLKSATEESEIAKFTQAINDVDTTLENETDCTCNLEFCLTADLIPLSITKALDFPIWPNTCVLGGVIYADHLSVKFSLGPELGRICTRPVGEISKIRTLSFPSKWNTDKADSIIRIAPE